MVLRSLHVTREVWMRANERSMKKNLVDIVVVNIADVVV